MKSLVPLLQTLALLAVFNACGDDSGNASDASHDGAASDTSVADSNQSTPDGSSTDAKACSGDEDCVLAKNLALCCPDSRCASAFNREYVEATLCVTASGNDELIGQCAPETCDECPGPPFTCAHAERAVCTGGTCEAAGPR